MERTSCRRKRCFRDASLSHWCARTSLPVSMIGFAKRLFLGFSAAGLFLLFWPLHSPVLRAQLSPPDHLAEPGFWPTQTATSRRDYVGSAACASCHAAVV